MESTTGLYCAVHDQITGTNGKGHTPSSVETATTERDNVTVVKKQGRKRKQKMVEEKDTTGNNYEPPAPRRSRRNRCPRSVVSSTCVCGEDVEDLFCDVHQKPAMSERSYAAVRGLHTVKFNSMCLCNEEVGLYCPVHDVITGEETMSRDEEQSEDSSKAMESSTEEEEDHEQSLINIARTLAWLKDKNKTKNAINKEQIPFSVAATKKLTLDDLKSYELSSHEVNHPAEDKSTQRLFKCQICQKAFKFRSRLKLHMVVHTKLAEFVCEHCGSSFTSSGNLKQHMTVHSNEKRFQCSYCNKRFKQSSHLKVHQLTHSGVKKHGCSICGKCFTQMNSLKVHMDFHMGTRCHECQMCGKKFVQKCDLQRHRTTHKEEGKFPCRICGDKFATLTILHQHSLVHLTMT